VGFSASLNAVAKREKYKSLPGNGTPVICHVLFCTFRAAVYPKKAD